MSYSVNVPFQRVSLSVWSSDNSGASAASLFTIRVQSDHAFALGYDPDGLSSAIAFSSFSPA